MAGEFRRGRRRSSGSTRQTPPGWTASARCIRYPVLKRPRRSAAIGASVLGATSSSIPAAASPCIDHPFTQPGKSVFLPVTVPPGYTGTMYRPANTTLYPGHRPAVVLVLVYLYFPFAALTLYSSIERFDWDQLRAAMDLGASPTRALRRILIPQIRPGIVVAVIFVFIPILGEYLAPQLVGGTRGVMIGNLIVNFFTGAQYTRGAAAALLIAALIVVLLLAFRKSLRVEDPYRA